MRRSEEFLGETTTTYHALPKGTIRVLCAVAFAVGVVFGAVATLLIFGNGGGFSA